MLNRRTFLAATAATPFIPRMALAAEQADVIIIGAGLSGLNAAMMLKEFGLRPVVLEADTHVGGRVLTVDTPEGPTDVGASQVGRGYARVIAMCNKLGLELFPEDRDLLPFGFHYKDNWIDPANWASHPLNKCVGAERELNPLLLGQAVMAQNNPLQNLQDWLDPKFGEFDVSMRAFMQNKGYSEQAIELAGISVPGIGMDQTSMLRMWQEDLRGKFDRRFSGENAPQQGTREQPFGEENDRTMVNGLAQISNIRGGCQALPKAMAATLGDAVRLNQRVAQIDMTDTGATVTCTDGTAYKGSFVISAIPFSMLRSVRINAAENLDMREAITQMPYANTARLYLKVKKPFWKEDGLPASFSTNGPIGMFWGIDNHTGEGEHRAMVVMVGQVASAMSAYDRETVEAMIMDELHRLRPASKGLMRIATYKDWSRDPLQKGCGFSLAPGQVNGFARTMTDPWQVMHFAGEHTRRMDFGMESAFESGERAAFEVFSRAG